MFLFVFYHVNLKLLVYLNFRGIMLLLVSVFLLNIHTLFFSYFFIYCLNVSFIVSFVNKLSFMFPLALLIIILLSIFWYSWSIYFLFRYLSNHFPSRLKFRLWIFYNFLLSNVFFNLYLLVYSV